MNILNKTMNLLVALGTVALVGYVAHLNGAAESVSHMSNALKLCFVLGSVCLLFAIRELSNFSSSYLK